MSGWAEIDLRPDAAALRRFGLIAVVGFGLLALAAWREKAVFAMGLGGARLPIAMALASLAAFSGVSSLVHPGANRPIYVGLSVLSFPLGFAVSLVVMAVLFFVVFGGVAIFMRLFARDPMTRAFDPSAPSYWTTPPGHPKNQPRSGERYFRQF